MANVTEESIFDSGIYQIETTDPVEGGALGISNKQAKGLANRTRWLYDNTWRTGDIKEVDCSNTYIADNFDSTGLGKNERLGWAICNGQNGTKDRGGLVSLGYDATNYATLGATGGSETHTLTIEEMPSHSHDITVSESDSGNADARVQGGTLESINTNTVDVQLKGGGLAHNNMQPYIVTLFIQKL